MFLLKKRGLLFYFLFITLPIFGQQQLKPNVSYLRSLRMRYEHLEEDNEEAIPFAHNYIEQAKLHKKYEHIFQGYKVLIFYSKDRRAKLVYADSCVAYATESGNAELISHAYLSRGIVYYFFLKKYQTALDEYLKAYDHAQKIKNEYLKTRIIYHVGVAKSYLGYYEEALELFEQCIGYFEPIIHSDAHPTIIRNNQKGYFNSLHQQIICYQNLNNLAKSDSLTTIGLSALPEERVFLLEKAYFLKSSGISAFHKSEYHKAITAFNQALPQLQYFDFAWTSVSYFYLGKSYLQLQETEKAISYFQKVDSIFQEKKFILPEVRYRFTAKTRTVRSQKSLSKKGTHAVGSCQEIQHEYDLLITSN